MTFPVQFWVHGTLTASARLLGTWGMLMQSSNFQGHGYRGPWQQFDITRINWIFLKNFKFMGTGDSEHGVHTL